MLALRGTRQSVYPSCSSICSEMELTGASLSWLCAAERPARLEHSGLPFCFLFEFRLNNKCPIQMLSRGSFSNICHLGSLLRQLCQWFLNRLGFTMADLIYWALFFFLTHLWVSLCQAVLIVNPCTVPINKSVLAAKQGIDLRNMRAVHTLQERFLQFLNYRCTSN